MLEEEERQEVKIADSLKEVEEISNSLLGMHLVTHQTGPEGKK